MTCHINDTGVVVCLLGIGVLSFWARALDGDPAIPGNAVGDRGGEEDDDEDVLGIDSYIEKMRDDGQWGGNVEVVAAARCYDRDIIVFSSEVANGVLSFSCNVGKGKKVGAKESLMLSYHGNDHYNSVQSTACAASQRSLRRGDEETHTDINTTLSKKEKCRSKAPPRSSKNGKSLSADKIKQTTERLSNTMEDVKASESNRDESEFIGSFKVLAI
jgi:hypothetical protein